MNADEIINSGLLELYAMGAASDEERQQVESALKESAEVRDELERIELTMEEVAYEERVEVPLSVKSDLMKRIGGEEQEDNVRPIHESPSVDSREKRDWWKIAATVFLLMSVGTNIALFFQVDRLEQRLANMKEQREQLAGEIEVQRTKLEGLRGDLNAVLKPGNRAVNLKGLGPRPGAEAMVYWNSNNGQVMLSLEQLDPLPNDQQYQLWALKDGKPIDAGVFEVYSEKYILQQMNQIKDADAFAVTIEPRGGSKTPTLEKLCLKGAVS